MNIGTAVPTAEELKQVPHHFVQHLSIHDPYSVGDYTRDALALLPQLFQEHEVVIMVGGSGMYADAVMYGLDEFPEVDPAIRPQLTAIYQQEELKSFKTYYGSTIYGITILWISKTTSLDSSFRNFLDAGKPTPSFLGKKQIPDFFTSKTVVIDWEREQLYERINQRVDHLMVEAGLEEEARGLLEHQQLNALQTVGYREWFSHFNGQWDREKAIEEIKRTAAAMPSDKPPGFVGQQKLCALLAERN